MSARLTLAAWAYLAVAFVALILGARWLFAVAVVSAAVAWILNGLLDYRDKQAEMDARRAHLCRPPEPEGVRIVHPDGTTTKCEVFYVGIHETGLHEWEVTTRMHEGDTLRADVDCKTIITATVDDAVTGAVRDGDGYRMEGR